MAISLYDYAFTPRLPTLHYGFMPGCPACAQMTPIVDKVVEAARGAIQLQKYDVTVPGAIFPLPSDTVPVLALSFDGQQFVKYEGPADRFPLPEELNRWIWATHRRLRPPIRGL